MCIRLQLGSTTCQIKIGKCKRYLFSWNLLPSNYRCQSIESQETSLSVIYKNILVAITILGDNDINGKKHDNITKLYNEF